MNYKNNFTPIHPEPQYPQISRQQTLTYYTSNTLGNFDGIENESIIDKELTTNERIDIMKTLAYNFFDNNTMYFSYFILNNKMPQDDQIKAQFGFINCKSVEERIKLFIIYKTVLYKCYPDLFVFKPHGLLYQYFIEDRIADFIIESYSRIKCTDSNFMWFMNNQHIVKHNINYYEFMERKQRLFQKKVHF
jgi:hypothetical protein